MGTVIRLDAHRLGSRVLEAPERLPLVVTATIGAVSLVLAGEIELFASPAQCRELAADLERLANEAEGLECAALSIERKRP